MVRVRVHGISPEGGIIPDSDGLPCIPLDSPVVCRVFWKMVWTSRTQQPAHRSWRQRQRTRDCHVLHCFLRSTKWHSHLTSSERCCHASAPALQCGTKNGHCGSYKVLLSSNFDKC